MAFVLRLFISEGEVESGFCLSVEIEEVVEQRDDADDDVVVLVGECISVWLVWKVFSGKLFYS